MTKSKKRSASSSPSPLSEHHLHLDNNLGKRLAEWLTSRGVPCALHTARFEHDARDEDWVPEVVLAGSVIVTCDRGRSDGIMLHVLCAAKARAVLLHSLLPEEQAELLESHGSRVAACLAKYPGPLLVKVTKSEVKARTAPSGEWLQVLGNGKMRSKKK